MAETKSGGLYLGTDGKLHDATGKVIVESVQQEQPQHPTEAIVEKATDAADDGKAKKSGKAQKAIDADDSKA